MSELRKIVSAYMAADDRTEAWVAKEMGISRSALNGWWNRGRTSAPSSSLLRALARVTRTPYRSVLDAALIDYGYLPEEGQAHGNSPAEKSPDSNKGGSVTRLKPTKPTPPAPAKKAARKGASQGRQLRKRLDRVGEEPQVDPNPDDGGA